MSLRLLVIFFLLIGVFASAQQFNFKNYSLEDGLPRIGVYDIHQDQNGFLWIGTQGGGVCKFDGNKFQSFTRRNGLPSDNIRLVYFDKRNTLWCATDEGVCYFNQHEFISVHFKDSAVNERVRCIAEDGEGRIWLGTDEGLRFINIQSKSEDTLFNLAQNFPDSTVRSVLVFQNKMWLGTDSGLYVVEKNEMKLFELQEKLNAWRILSLFADKENNLWVGTSNGVNKIQGQEVISFSTKEGLINNRVRAISQDSYGHMWFGTFQGISIYDGQNIISINKSNGLSDERIRCIYHDNFDNMWVGTFYGGISRYNHKDFLGFSTYEGLPSNQIQAIAEDEYGDLLIGTNAGFSTIEVVDNKLYNYSTLKLSDSYLGNSIRAILYDQNGYVWLGNNQGITIIKGDYRREIKFPSPEKERTNAGVTAIKFLNGKYFVGTQFGLFQVKVVGDYKSFEIINLSENNKMGGVEVSCIVADNKKRVWVGFADGSLSVYDQTRIVTPTGHEIDRVLSIAIDTSGVLWIGTNGNGLYEAEYDSKSMSLKAKNYSTKEELNSNYIYSILIAENKIWLGHERGLDILVKDKNGKTNMLHCGSEIGFKGLQNFPNASLKDSKGNLWFGTIDGLYRLNGREVKSFLEGSESKVFITALKINEQNIDWQNSEWCDTIWGLYNLPVNLNLPYDKNNLEFEFIALNYIAPEKLKFSWKLEGFDSEWSKPSSDIHVKYTNLDDGIYTFRIRATNELGIVTENEQTLTFIIHKPFWQTWWFRLLFIFLGTLIGISIMRWRTRSLREKQIKLERLIEERTVEIKHQNEMLEEKNKEITDSIFYSRRIQRSILPAKEKVAKLLDHYFIFFRPKDIVSGDFYWSERSLDKKKIFFAVADCTGHGVPGAMVSLIGTRALNTALREQGIDVACEILDAVNESMIESFTDAATGTVIKDGMDVALCSIEYLENNAVGFQYAGAQNPVWIVRKENEDDLVVNGTQIEPSEKIDGYKLFEIKADKQPIGYFDGRKNFTNKTTTLKKGDRIYLFSDGFADQFGGDKGKKFKYKTLKELLLSVQHHSVEDQYGIVRDSFYDWKREFEQIDDVCLMGVEI